MVKEQVSKFKGEFRKHSVVAITAALSFVIALFWRDAVQAVIDDWVATFSIENVYILKLVAAVAVTILAVIGLMIIAKWDHEEVSE